MLQNQKGFTLVELIAVMIIIGILGTLVVVKFDTFIGVTKKSTLTLSIEELNNREKMSWYKIKLTDQGYTDDNTLFGIIDYDLGQAKWIDGPTAFGGTIGVDSGNIVLIRTASTETQPARWKE